ncbi:MAG: hypothetical protein FWC57_02720 [Endomicrobia bacterium]|nr:hypothetical protein [Endomicrobiia bacterium]
MYDINLLEKTIETSKKNVQAVKFLRLLSLFLTLGFLAAVALLAYTFYNTQKTTERINQLKMNIDEKRRTYKLKDIENEWTLNFYKLSAVKDMITGQSAGGSSKAGLMFREIGLYMPKDYKIADFALGYDNIIKESIKIKDYNVKDIEKYTQELQEGYARSMYVSSNVVVDTTTVAVSVRGNKIEVSPVTVPYVREKK